MKTLSHNTLVRLPGWNEMTYARVGTIIGYFAQYKEDGAEAEKRAIAKGEPIAWTLYRGACLVGGKDRHTYYDAERKKSASALTLNDGETVEIEARQYSVKVIPRNAHHPTNSDPIHFIPHPPIVLPPGDATAGDQPQMRKADDLSTIGNPAGI